MQCTVIMSIRQVKHPMHLPDLKMGGARMPQSTAIHKTQRKSQIICINNTPFAIIDISQPTDGARWKCRRLKR